MFSSSTCKTTNLAEDFKLIPYAIQVATELHVVSEDYTAQKSDELSIKRSEFVEVLAKSMTGFWKVKLFNESEGLVPAVCLKKIIQNQSVPITLKNSIQYKNNIKTKSNSQHEHMPPIKEHLTLKTDALPKKEVNTNNEMAKEVTTINPQFQAFSSSSMTTSEIPKIPEAPNHVPPPIPLTLSSDEIWYSIENYVDAVGDGISFEKGQKFKVQIKETNGWWFVKNLESNIEGWAPSSYLATLPPLKPKPNKIVNRTDSIDSIQMEFNQIFETMFPKAAEKLLEKDRQNLSKLNEEIVKELIKPIEKSQGPEPPPSNLKPKFQEQNMISSVNNVKIDLAPPEPSSNSNDDKNHSNNLKETIQTTEPIKEATQVTIGTNNEILDRLKRLKRVQGPK